MSERKEPNPTVKYILEFLSENWIPILFGFYVVISLIRGKWI